MNKQPALPCEESKNSLSWLPFNLSHLYACAMPVPIGCCLRTCVHTLHPHAGRDFHHFSDTRQVTQFAWLLQCMGMCPIPCTSARYNCTKSAAQQGTVNGRAGTERASHARAGSCPWHVKHRHSACCRPWQTRGRGVPMRLVSA